MQLQTTAFCWVDGVRLDAGINITASNQEIIVFGHPLSGMEFDGQTLRLFSTASFVFDISDQDHQPDIPTAVLYLILSNPMQLQ